MKRFHVATVGLCVLLLGAGCARQGKGSTTTADGFKTIYFDFDQSSVKAEYEPVLKNGSDWLQKHKGKSVTIEGHCDERGTNEYNIALGDRRAKSTQSYLKNLGVDAANLSTVSFGEEKPVETCSEESCWWKNRRADFKE